MTIVFVFVVVGGVLFALLGNYATRQKEEVFLDYAKKINEFSEIFVDDSSDNRFINLYLASISENSESLIFIVDQFGDIVATSNIPVANSIGKLKKEQYFDIIMGKTIKKIGTFEGVYKKPVLTVGVPLKYNGEIIGAVIFNAPIPDIYNMRNEVIGLFLLACIIALLTALVLIYFTSRQLSKSIKDVSKSAKAIACGNFSERVSVKSKDEVGELAQSFNQMADSIQRFELTRRSFIANASHELRTPVTTISGFIEGIVDETIPQSEQKKYLEIVLSEVRRLSRLANDLLDIARLEGSNGKLDLTVFEINEIIRLTIISFENRIDGKNLDVQINFIEDCVYVEADSDAIQRVITNLLDNAIKYSNDNGYIKITVGYHSSNVVISVENSGNGISEKDLKHIWDRFYKADKSRGTDKSGVGLGLFIVKNIIHQHHQKIYAQSVEGKYTRFVFTLKKAEFHN